MTSTLMSSTPQFDILIIYTTSYITTGVEYEKL